MRRILVALVVGMAPAAAQAAAPGGLLPTGSCLARYTAQFPGCAALGGGDFPTPMALAPSPDGTRLYVASRGERTVRLYRRDPGSGALSAVPGAEGGCIASADTPEGCVFARGLANPWELAVAPDGKHLYVVNPDKPGGGVVDTLVPVNLGPDGAMTPRVACFRDDAATGIDCNGILPLPDPELPAIAAPTGIAIPDAKTVYVTGSDGVALLARNPDNGSLTHVQCYGTAPCSALPQLGNGDALAVAVSPDGRTVAVADGLRTDDGFYPTGKRVTAMRRDLDDGELHLTNSCVSIDAVGCADENALYKPTALAFSPDGAHLYAASYGGNAVVAMRVTGLGTIGTMPGGCAGQGAPGCTDAAPLQGPVDLAVSPDGEHVYAAATSFLSEGKDALGVFRRDLAAPDCADTTLATPHRTPLTITLACADGDDALALEVARTTPNGTLGAIDQSARTIAFTPARDFSGRTSFTVRALGGTLASREATITVNVGAPLRRITAAVANRWAYSATRTKVLELKVRDVPAGATVEVRCAKRRHGCPFARKVVKPKGKQRTVDLRPLLERKTVLRAGAKVTVRITMPGAIGRHVAYKLRAGRIPKVTTRCLPPGSSKPARC